jgi:hypothetical protein
VFVCEHLNNTILQSDGGLFDDGRKGGEVNMNSYQDEIIIKLSSNLPMTERNAHREGCL